MLQHWPKQVMQFISWTSWAMVSYYIHICCIHKINCRGVSGLSDGPRGLLSDRHKLVADFVAFANKARIHFFLCFLKKKKFLAVVEGVKCF